MMLPIRSNSLGRFGNRFLGLLMVGVALSLTVYLYDYLASLRPEVPLPLSPKQVQQFLKSREYELWLRTQGKGRGGLTNGGVLRQDKTVIDSDLKAKEELNGDKFQDNVKLNNNGNQNLSNMSEISSNFGKPINSVSHSITGGLDINKANYKKVDEEDDSENNDDKIVPQSQRMLTALPPTHVTSAPLTFIPDQPDASPLARPPDIPKKFLIEEADFCHQRPSLQIIAYVHSSIERISHRNLTRNTWANASAYDMGDISVKIGVVFMVGRAKSDEEQRIVQEESQRFHDIVQGDYGDHYRLLTYKGLASLYWISRHCAHVPWTLHSDDDTHIDIFLYHRALQELDMSKKMFVCSHMYGPVLRSSRWKVRYEEHPAKNYPLYCSGGVWFLQTKFVPLLLEASKSVNFLWVDDAYITGLLARKAGIGHFPFQKYYGGPNAKTEKLGQKVAWFVKFVPRWDWWNKIVKYHRNHSMHNPVTLIPH